MISRRERGIGSSRRFRHFAKGIACLRTGAETDGGAAVALTRPTGHPLQEPAGRRRPGQGTEPFKPDTEALYAVTPSRVFARDKCASSSGYLDE